MLLAAALGLCSIELSVAAPPAKPATHTVVVEAVTYRPNVLAIRAGDSVVWVNKDPFPHTVTSASAGFDSKVVEAGKSWKLTLRKRGELRYVCTLQPTMAGILRVE